MARILFGIGFGLIAIAMVLLVAVTTNLPVNALASGKRIGHVWGIGIMLVLVGMLVGTLTGTW